MKTSTKLKTFVVLSIAALSFAGGLSVRQPPKTVVKEVFVYEKVPVYQHIKKGTYYGKQRDTIAAALPASALRPVGRVQKLASK